jgi:hypothetical protein
LFRRTNAHSGFRALADAILGLDGRLVAAREAMGPAEPMVQSWWRLSGKSPSTPLRDDQLNSAPKTG